VIVYNGKLTRDFEYLNNHLKTYMKNSAGHSPAGKGETLRQTKLAIG